MGKMELGAHSISMYTMKKIQVKKHEMQMKISTMLVTKAVLTGCHQRCSNMYPRAMSKRTPGKTDRKTKAMVAKM